MYSWASLFVLLCVYEGYLLLNEERRRKINWILFTVFGVLSAYTHYFAFAAVIIIYLAYFGVLIFRNRQNIWKCILSIVISIILYLPWLSTFFYAVDMKSENFWNKYIPSFKECLNFFFGKRSLYFWSIFFICLIIIILREIRILCIEKNKMEYEIKINDKRGKVSNETISVCVATLSMLIVIIFGIIYDKAVNPIFICRYLYPLTASVWLSFSIVISKIKLKQWFAALVAVFMLVTYIPAYTDYIDREKKLNDKTIETVEYINSNASEKTILYTDISHLKWTVLGYYFPDIKNELINNIDLTALSSNEDYFFFSKSKLNVEEYEMQNLYLEYIRTSYISDYKYYLYKIKKID